MPDTFDHELNAYLRNEDAKSEREWDLAEEIAELYSAIPNDYAELHKNGKHVNTFTHQEAIEYVIANDDDDNWTINDEAE